MDQEGLRSQQLHDQLSEQVQGNKEQILRMTTMVEQQGIKIDRMYNSLVGNGSSESVVARLLVAEQRQKEAASDRAHMSHTIDELNVCVSKLERQGNNDQRTILELKEGQEKISEDLEENSEVIQSWRNKAVGIGIGVGLGTSVIIYLLQQLINAAAVP